MRWDVFFFTKRPLSVALTCGLLGFAFFSGVAISEGRASESSVEGSASVSVRNAWARATPASLRHGALFLEIDNTGSSDDVLLSASIDGLTDRIEFHKTIQDGSIMQMRHVEQISLPAQKVTLFRPGGLHLMLKNLQAPLREGDAFTLNLTFEKAGTLRVPFAVGAMGAKAHPAPNAHVARSIEDTPEDDIP